MSENIQPEAPVAAPKSKISGARGCLEPIIKNAALLLTILITAIVIFSLARAAVYKIRPYERGLHLRGGRFVNVDEPGWHFQIPFVDTVIKIYVIERSGMIENMAAMTADDVTMDVSLLYTYRVSDPVRYQLEVLDPEKIVGGFVQGTLRDLVNTRMMDEVMHSRAEINQALMTELQKKEQQYGVIFILVQLQNASPPSEVVAAIKNKMVAEQLQEQASAEASQKRTVADSEFYAAQKKAEGEAYQITALAEAQAQQISLSSQAKVEALRAILSELDGKGTLAEDYIQVLIAQELNQNSKWVISNGGAMPILDLREAAATAEMPATTTP